MSGAAGYGMGGNDLCIGCTEATGYLVRWVIKLHTKQRGYQLTGALTNHLENVQHDTERLCSQ